MVRESNVARILHGESGKLDAISLNLHGEWLVVTRRSKKTKPEAKNKAKSSERNQANNKSDNRFSNLVV